MRYACHNAHELRFVRDIRAGQVGTIQPEGSYDPVERAAVTV